MAPAPQSAGSKPKVRKDCICCMAPAKLRCSGCQRVYFCSTEHQKAAWGVHKYLCKGSDLEAFRQPPLLREESDVYATSRRVNTIVPESALIGLEPHGKTGVLADVLRSENASVDPFEYVWKVFQSTFATTTPARSSLIVSLVRYNNYKNAKAYPTGGIDPKFPSHKAFCKVAVLACERDPLERTPPAIYYPEASTNEGFRQVALAYFIMHTIQRRGHIATDLEVALFESAIARVFQIKEELRLKGDESAFRINEIHIFLRDFVLAKFKHTWGLQKATGDPGPGDGQSWFNLDWPPMF
ncbi:hypothetical protein RQP46_003677 [Phenoliferia psychrophenolica]